METLPRPAPAPPSEGSRRPRSRDVKAPPVRGFLVRRPAAGLEWYLCLPAVMTFHYPVFRGMVTSPRIIYNEKRYSLETSVINVELVMIKTIQSLRGQRINLRPQALQLPLPL